MRPFRKSSGSVFYFYMRTILVISCLFIIFLTPISILLSLGRMSCYWGWFLNLIAMPVIWLFDLASMFWCVISTSWVIELWIPWLVALWTLYQSLWFLCSYTSDQKFFSPTKFLPHTLLGCAAWCFLAWKCFPWFEVLVTLLSSHSTYFLFAVPRILVPPFFFIVGGEDIKH